MPHTFLLVGVLFSTLGTPVYSTWDYKNRGEDWPGTCKSGIRQSPIAISLLEAEFDATLGPIKFEYSPRLAAGDFVNNGQTIAFTLTPGTAPSKISGGSLNSIYQLHSLHFHWGESNCDGSEHVVDFKPAPLEMHLVHFNGKYKSMDEATPNEDGLAVISVLFEPTKDGNDESESVLGSYLYSEINGVLDVLKYANGKVEDRNMKMSKFVDDFMKTDGDNNSRQDLFYRYLGSLTQPGCNESVTWTLMQKRIDISPSLLAKFRMINLMNVNGDAKPSLNNRAIQKLNGRRVTSNNPLARGSRANKLTVSTIPIVLSSAVFVVTLV